MMLKMGVVLMDTDTDKDKNMDTAMATLIIQSILKKAKRNNNDK